MRPGRRLASGGLLAAILIATFLVFSPILAHQFLNWDDPDTLVHNTHLIGPGILGWAFSTTHMSHYQPASWIAWSLVGRAFGVEPVALHAMSLAGHLLNTILVFLLAGRLARAARLTTPGVVAGIAATAAGLFAIHPLRVEPVAWASAFPYVAALFWLLLSALAYSRWAERTGATPRASSSPWLAGSIACYGLSLLCRPVALPFPLVLTALDVYPFRLTDQTSMASANRRSRRRLLLTKLPFLLLAVAALAAEWRARPIESVAEYGIGARLTAAAIAPFLYLWRTVWPVGLTPLDPLPLDPHLHVARLILGVAGLVMVTVVTVRLARVAPALSIGWISYLLLLAPAVGLTPSGLQATADRYTYVPGVALAVMCGAATGAVWRSSRHASRGRACGRRPDHRAELCHERAGVLVARFGQPLDTGRGARSAERHRPLQSRGGARRGRPRHRGDGAVQRNPAAHSGSRARPAESGAPRGPAVRARRRRAPVEEQACRCGAGVPRVARARSWRERRRGPISASPSFSWARATRPRAISKRHGAPE